MFKYKKAIPLSYEIQGRIYFESLGYAQEPQYIQARVDKACRIAGGEYKAALKEFVTTQKGAQEICTKYFLSRSTLERCVKRYYVAYAEMIG